MKREVLWKGHAAYVNGKMCSVKRISAFSWEVRVNNKTFNCHPTRSQARRWAEDYARGVMPSAEAEGTRRASS